MDVPDLKPHVYGERAFVVIGILYVMLFVPFTFEFVVPPAWQTGVIDGPSWLLVACSWGGFVGLGIGLAPRTRAATVRGLGASSSFGAGAVLCGGLAYLVDPIDATVLACLALVAAGLLAYQLAPWQRARRARADAPTARVIARR